MDKKTPLFFTLLQLNDTNAVPSNSAAKPDASSAATDDGVVTTVTDTTEVAPPLLDTCSSPPRQESAVDGSQVWNYAENRIFLTERSDAAQEGKSSRSDEVEEKNIPGYPKSGTSGSGRYRSEESQQTKNDQESAKLFPVSLSESEKPRGNYTESEARSERTGENGERKGDIFQSANEADQLNNNSAGPGNIEETVTEQGDDESHAAYTAAGTVTRDRLHQDQNDPISNPATPQGSEDFGADTDTDNNKPKPSQAIPQRTAETESQVNKANELSDGCHEEKKGYVSSSQVSEIQSNTEVKYSGPSVSETTADGYQDTDLNNGPVKHDYTPAENREEDAISDAASVHTGHPVTVKEHVVDDDYNEHEESVPFNLTIFLQNERSSKPQPDKKQPISSLKSAETATGMETRPQTHTLNSQADVPHSSEEKGQKYDQQTTHADPLDSKEGRKRTNLDSGGGQDILDSKYSDEKRPPSQQQQHHADITRSESRGSKSSKDRTPIGDSHKAEDMGSVSRNPDTDAMSQYSSGRSEKGTPEQESSPTQEAEAEYGSPTRPKPPMTPFQKPSPQRMAELDRHVLMTPKQLSKFPAFELAQYLLSSTRTEVETAYVIFRWVTCQLPRQGQTTPRAEEKEEGEVGEGTETVVPTLDTYVNQLYSGRLDHADLFSLLCKCVNLETHTVDGRFRLYCPQPSPQLVRTRPSSWSALLLPGGWGIVDCALGARYWASEAARRASVQRARRRPRTGHVLNERSKEAVAGTSDSAVSESGLDSERKRFGERLLESAILRACPEYSPHNFYFLPPPQLLVTSHLPDNPCWQLLPHPVAETDFLTSLLKKPHLHYLGVDLMSPSSLRLTEISEEMDVTWKFKGEGLRRFAFRFFSLGDGESCHQELTRHGFLENQHSRGVVGLRLIPPTSGRYVCELYGTYMPTRGNEMIHLCSFDLDFVKTTSSPLKFPHNDRVEWGPGAECVSLGLTPSSHITGCINVNKGETELVFAFSKPVLVTQKLLSAADEGQGMEVLRSTINFRDSKNRIKILLRIPDPGDYVLSLYAKEEFSSGKCQLVCNYLVLCDSGTPEVVHSFPSLPFNKLGPTKAFFDLSMKLVCPKRSCIVVAPYSGKVTFVFGSPMDTELSYDLLHQGEELADSGDHVQHTYQSGESVFRARLPLAGDYIFHLYGKTSDGEGHKFLLYSAVIECAVPNKDCLPLPRVVTEWRSRVQILAPLRKCLVLGVVTHFAVRAYKVKAIAIVSQSGVQNFMNEDEEEDEGKEQDGENTEGIADNADTGEPDDNTKTQTDKPIDQNQGYKDQDHLDTVNGSVESQIQKKETSQENETGVLNGNHEMDESNSRSLHHDTASLQSDENDLPFSRHASATKKVVTMTQEDDADDDDEREEEWQVWRCKVKVDREDEGSAVKLCVQPYSSQDSHMICVAEFEVITERNMAAKLDHQHAEWAAAADNFKVRPDSGHRSDIDDEERQSAYFLDDEVYLSNPLGDDNSDSDDSDNFSQEDDEDEDSTDDVASSGDETDSDFEDTATTSGSSTAKQDRRKSELQDSGSKSPRRNAASDQKLDKGDPATKKATVSPRKGKKAGQARTFRPSAVYNAPQPYSIKEMRQRAALKQKEKTSSEARRGEKMKRPGKEQRKKETEKEKPFQAEMLPSEDKTEHAASHRNKGKNADGSTNRQDSDAKERTLRRKMWKACQRREREAIRKAVRNYTRRDYPPCPDLAAAERLLHLFKLQDVLVEALASDDLEAIRHALTEVERHGFAGEMSVECRKAHALLSPHRNHGRFLDLKVETDMRTLMEIRSYRCPPHVVHHVIVATLLLLGVHEGLTKTWKRCRRRLQVLGRQGILKKMVKIRVESVHPEISARARLLLDKHSTEEAFNAGPGVLAVYNWATNVLSRVENLTELDDAYTGDGTSHPPHPATKRRQREIFRQQITTTPSTTTTTSSTAVTTKTTTTTTTTTKHQGSEVQKTKGSKQAGAETPRNRNNNKLSREPDRNAGIIRKGPGSQPGGREVTKRVAGRQGGQTDSKKKTQSADALKPSAGVAAKASPGHTTMNTNSNNVLKPKPAQENNTPATTRKRQPNTDEAKTLSPGYYPRPQPPVQNGRKDNSDKSIRESHQSRSPHADRSSHRIPTNPRSSPERSFKPGTAPSAANKPSEDTGRPQQTPRSSTVRYDQPQEQLRSLSPRKSPLFRPANRTKSRTDNVRSRPLHRPKTTPTPVLQSTFFFASLLGKEGEGEDGEVNNNIPLTFTNYSNGPGGLPTAKTPTGRDSRAGVMTETRLGQRGDQRYPAPGRRSISDITTPDI
ncbi:hypothetical protein ACOMHN_033277 [Nucella lapillus]